MANQWFRLYSEFATDAKVQTMSEEMQRRLIMIFCLQSTGEYEKLSHDELRFALRLCHDDLCDTLVTLRDKGFLDEQNRVKNWGKRQFITDRKDPTAAERQRKCRERKKKRDNRDTVTPPSRPDTDTESDTEKGKEKNILKKEKFENRFEDFWVKFPRQRRGNKQKAQKAYENALKRDTEENIHAGLDNYRKSDEVIRGFAKGAEAWLNDDRWRSEYRRVQFAPSKTERAIEAVERGIKSLPNSA